MKKLKMNVRLKTRFTTVFRLLREFQNENRLCSFGGISK